MNMSTSSHFKVYGILWVTFLLLSQFQAVKAQSLPPHLPTHVPNLALHQGPPQSLNQAQPLQENSLNTLPSLSYTQIQKLNNQNTVSLRTNKTHRLDSIYYGYHEDYVFSAFYFLSKLIYTQSEDGLIEYQDYFQKDTNGILVPLIAYQQEYDTNDLLKNYRYSYFSLDSLQEWNEVLYFNSSYHYDVEQRLDSILYFYDYLNGQDSTLDTILYTYQLEYNSQGLLSADYYSFKDDMGLVSITSAKTYAYDSLGRLHEESTLDVEEGIVGDIRGTIRYTYYPGGKLHKVEDIGKEGIEDIQENFYNEDGTINRKDYLSNYSETDSMYRYSRVEKYIYNADKVLETTSFTDSWYDNQVGWQVTDYWDYVYDYDFKIAYDKVKFHRIEIPIIDDQLYALKSFDINTYQVDTLERVFLHDYFYSELKPDDSQITSQDLENWLIYPNPTLGNAIISIPSFSGVTDLSIYDSNGQLISKLSVSDTSEINMSDYPRGVYLCTIEVDGKLRTKRLVKTE